MSRYSVLLICGWIVLSIDSPAYGQPLCTTNFCIRSQSLSYRTPSGWPAVPIAPCCKTNWGSLPGGLDWSNGAPIMICTGNADYAETYPNCGEPNNLSQPFPLSYDRPQIGIGVAWPNPKDYRYEVQSVPLAGGPDGSCAQFSNRADTASNWWVFDLKDPKRGSYVFTAVVSFERGEKGYYAVLANCTLQPPQ